LCIDNFEQVVGEKRRSVLIIIIIRVSHLQLNEALIASDQKNSTPQSPKAPKQDWVKPNTRHSRMITSKAALEFNFTQQISVRKATLNRFSLRPELTREYTVKSSVLTMPGNIMLKKVLACF
jgi:hypothetical protein